MATGNSQLILPNYKIPYVGGLCEGYVEGTVGQATLPTPSSPTTYGVFPSATAAWKANFDGGNHPGELPPPGLRMAVYFTLGSTPAGHTAIQLEDGRIATTPKAGYHANPGIYPSLQAMIDDYAKHNNGCTYLGWSECIGKLRIIGEDMDKVDKEIAQILSFGIVGRNGLSGRTNGLDDIGVITGLIGRELNAALIRELFYSDEAKKWRDSGEYGSNPNIQERLDSIPALEEKIKELEQGTGDFTKVISASQDLYIKEK